MSEHFLVTADHGHLRIFAHQQSPEQMAPGLTEVESLDFPHGVQSFVEGDTDVAGRFQGSKQQLRGPGAPTARTGMSIDERLPMQEEEQRRRAADVAGRIDAFFRNHPEATWDLAAGASLRNAICNLLSPPVRARLMRSVPKNLVHQPVSELLSHFSEK